MGTFATGGNYRTADPRLVAIAQAAAARSPYNVVLFSGERGGNSRSQHYGGNAIDIVLIDPQTGREIPNLGAGGDAFAAYESFARTMRETQQQIAPDLSGNFRWGGYFGPTGLNSTGLDLMHFDLGPTQNMALGTWEGGLNERGRTFVANAGAGQTYSATQGPGAQSSPQMAYTAPAATPAAQGAINAAAGPAAGLPSPAPAPGSQRLFRPISEARTAREGGGTPRLDELSSIIQQRRAGMNPLLDRLTNFFQTRRAARQDNQTAPTPPAPIPATAARPSGGGGSNADPAVVQLQQELAAAGFDPGPIDGLMGPRTRAAMAARDAAAARPAPTTGAMPRPRPQQVAGMDPMAAPVPPPNPLRGPPPLPPQNPARMGQPAAPNAQANLNYGIPIAPMAPTPISGPAPGSLTTGSLTPMTPPGPAATANLNFGIPIQPRNPANAPTPSANPTLGPMLAGYDTPGNGVGIPTPPVSGGILPDAAPNPANMTAGIDPAGILGRLPQLDISMPGWGSQAPTRGPGAGGRAVSTNPTTLVSRGPDGYAGERQLSIENGIMPAGRNNFGNMGRLPAFHSEPDPALVMPQSFSQPRLNRPVTSTDPGGVVGGFGQYDLPYRRTLPIPEYWRRFLGAGV